MTRAREAEYYPDFTNPGHGTDVEDRMGGAGRGEGVYNVVVIGGGTAGLVTAAGTAALGSRAV